MSCNIHNYIDCPALQDRLLGNFQRLAPNYREMNPFTGFLISPTNTNNTLQKQIDVGNSHIRTVELRYRARLTEDQTTSNAVQNCDGGQKSGETSIQYQIDTEVGTETSWTITLKNLIKRCEADENWFADELQARMDVMGRTINTKNIKAAALLKGDFANDGGGSSSASIHVATKNSSGVYIADALERIPFEFMRMDYNSTVYLFGGSMLFYNYFKSMAGMCCNTTFGMDLPALFADKPLAPLYDRKIDQYIGSNEILAVAPGALQFLTYLEFRGMAAITDPVYKQGVIVDTFTGHEYDYLAKWDCGSWNFQLKLAHSLEAMPGDMFCADDRMNGVTWANGFKIVNA